MNAMADMDTGPVTKILEFAGAHGLILRTHTSQKKMSASLPSPVETQGYKWITKQSAVVSSKKSKTAKSSPAKVA